MLRNFLKTFGNDEEAKLDFKKIIGDHQSHKARFDTISIVAIPADRSSHFYRKLLKKKTL